MEIRKISHVTKQGCPVCGSQARVDSFAGSATRANTINCLTCGTFRVTQEAMEALRDFRAEQLQPLSWIIASWPIQQESPIKSTDVSRLISEGLSREPSVIGKARMLLEEIRRRSSKFGEAAPFDWDRDWPKIRARGADECTAILNHLETDGKLTIVAPQDLKQVKLTWAGWREIESVRGSNQDTVFVAMAFNEGMKPAFGAMKLAIEKAKLTPLQLNQEHFTDKICERILTEIRRCAILVADVTDHRQNVYFEAGYALALEKTVVWTCRKSDIAGVHFDTRQYPHIIWDSPVDLVGKLYERLQYLTTLRDPK